MRWLYSGVIDRAPATPIGVHVDTAPTEMIVEVANPEARAPSRVLVKEATGLR